MKNRFAPILIILALIGYAALASWPLIHKPAPKPIPITVFDSVIDLNGSKFPVAKTANPQKGVVIYIEDQEQLINGKDLFRRIAEISYVAVKIKWQDLALLNCQEQIQLTSALIQAAFSREKFSAELLPIVIADNKAAGLVFSLMKEKSLHAGISLHMPLIAPTEQTQICPHASAESQSETIDLHANWYIFNSPLEAGDTQNQAAINKIPNAKFTITDQASDSAVKEAVQIMQWLDPRLKDQLSSAKAKGSLPIIEVPGLKGPFEGSGIMTVFLTGDGGWAAIDKNIAAALAEQGIPTLGFDSLSYFWKARTPRETALDIEKITKIYLKKWNKEKVVFVGYSFGADVMPFLLTQFPEAFKEKITLVALLSMGKTASFEFKLSSWMNADKRPERPPTLPELQKIKGMNIVCFYGLKDPDSVCNQTKDAGAIPIGLPGNHHFNDDYPLLMKHLNEHLNLK